MKQLLLVFLGGGLGSSLRYWISKYLNNSESTIPYGTFTVNVLGSLLIGVLLGFALKSSFLSQNTTLLLATGFCGGFTTFSAFAHENYMLLKSGDITSFALYTIGSLLISIVAVFVGVWLSKFI